MEWRVSPAQLSGCPAVMNLGWRGLVMCSERGGVVSPEKGKRWWHKHVECRWRRECVDIGAT